MTTFTATPDPAGRFVTLTVTDLTAASVLTITRDPSPGSTTVRGTPVELPAAGATVITDLEFPYGQPLTYTAVLRDPTTNTTTETLTADAAAVTVPGSGMVVSDPISNTQVLCTVADQRDERSSFRGYRYDLAGRSAPLYLLEKHAGWAWLLELVTVDVDDRATLDQLTRDGSPMLLRVTDPACDLRTGWVVPEDVAVDRVTVPASDTRRRWSVRVGQVDPPASTVEGVAVTLTDLHEYQPGTLQQLADMPPATLLELSLAVVADA